MIVMEVALFSADTISWIKRIVGQGRDGPQRKNRSTLTLLTSYMMRRGVEVRRRADSGHGRLTLSEVQR